jgi:membrane protein implicated in regulation of membrane protease activity
MVLIQKKGFGAAILFWLFLGAFGVHRIYVQEKIHYIFWYWAANVCTFGILMIVDVFLLKGMIEKKYEEDKQREKVLNAIDNMQG